MKRIGGLFRKVRKGDVRRGPEGLTPAEEVDACRKQLRSQQELVARLVEEQLRPALRDLGTPVLDVGDLEPSQRDYLARYFADSVEPILIPLAADAADSILRTYDDDNYSAWDMQPDGKYSAGARRPARPGGAPSRRSSSSPPLRDAAAVRGRSPNDEAGRSACHAGPCALLPEPRPGNTRSQPQTVRGRLENREVVMAEMTEGIIVGYDGSPGSELALHWAAREASDRGITLTVCHAWAPEDLALLIDPPLLDVTRRQGVEIVGRGVQHAEPFAGPGGVQPLLAAGSPARVLCERSGPSTLLIVGSRGHGRLAGLLLGSVAWQLAGHAQGRIVIVRKAVRKANGSPGPVVAGVDGSPTSDAVLLFAAEEAALRNVPVLAVCALADAPGHLGGARQVEEEFSSLLTRWEKEHPGVTMLRQVSQGSPRTALLEAGAEAQMIIVGSRGRGGVPSMTLGSVAGALLHYAPCPVGIVRLAAAA